MIYIAILLVKNTKQFLRIIITKITGLARLLVHYQNHDPPQYLVKGNTD